MSDEAPKPRKQKNFAQINGACKMAHLSDGLSPKACPVCGTVSKLGNARSAAIGAGRNRAARGRGRTTTRREK